MAMQAPPVYGLKTMHPRVRVWTREAAHEQPRPDSVELRQREVQAARDFIRRDVARVD
ncbi:hypothetical protein [Methylorubrum salsuginis]|uniref:hypothetical protein n=1 Tax=Methylorubrum salsuginis TaxID=414703 RepID=UPI0013F4D8DE|nr:hypothetical protein [Methylorubrum salsuginis]